MLLQRWYLVLGTWVFRKEVEEVEEVESCDFLLRGEEDTMAAI